MYNTTVLGYTDQSKPTTRISLACESPTAGQYPADIKRVLKIARHFDWMSHFLYQRKPSPLKFDDETVLTIPSSTQTLSSVHYSVKVNNIILLDFVCARVHKNLSSTLLPTQLRSSQQSCLCWSMGTKMYLNLLSFLSFHILFSGYKLDYSECWNPFFLGVTLYIAACAYFDDVIVNATPACRLKCMLVTMY